MSNRSGSVLSGLLMTVVFFAAIEVGALLLYKVAHLTRSSVPLVVYPYHPYLGWENLPNHLYTGSLAGGLHRWANRTDSLGESITPLESAPDPAVTIAVVGGSAVFGVGQSDNAHTVASQLERQLHERTGLRVEVHDLAVGGYTSFQEALTVERFLARRHADVVVSMSGYNDAFAAAIEGGPDFGLLLRRLDPKTELVRAIERGDPKVLPVASGIAFGALRRHSYAIDLLGKFADKIRRPAPAVPWAAMPDSTEIVHRARFVLTNYAMMDGMTRQNGGRFFLFLQPTALNRTRLTPEERAAMDSLSKDFMDRVRPVMKIFYPALVAAPKTFEFRDLSGSLDDFAAPAFADECHFLDAATPVLAGAIADVITPAVLDAARRAGAASPPARR